MNLVYIINFAHPSKPIEWVGTKSKFDNVYYFNKVQRAHQRHISKLALACLLWQHKGVSSFPQMDPDKKTRSGYKTDPNTWDSFYHEGSSTRRKAGASIYHTLIKWFRSEEIGKNESIKQIKYHLTCFNSLVNQREKIQTDFFFDKKGNEIVVNSDYRPVDPSTGEVNEGRSPVLFLNWNKVSKIDELEKETNRWKRKAFHLKTEELRGIHKTTQLTESEIEKCINCYIEGEERVPFKEQYFSSISEEDNEKIVGREWLVDQVDEFITNPVGGIFFITGSPGIGKTRAMDKICYRFEDQEGVDVFYYRFGSQNNSRVIGWVEKILNSLTQEYGLEHNIVLEKNDQVADEFSRFLERISSKLKRTNRKILILLDGIDATSDYDHINELIPVAEYSRILFVISCRNKGDFDHKYALFRDPSVKQFRVEHLNISKQTEDNERDLREYIVAVAPDCIPQSIDEIISLSNGNFQYVEVLFNSAKILGADVNATLNEIKLFLDRDRGPDNGLNEIYSFYWAIVKRDVDRSKRTNIADLKACFSMIVSVMDALTDEHFLLFLGDDWNMERFEKCMYYIREFLEYIDGENVHQKRYYIYHETFRSFIIDELEEASKRNAHKEIAQTFLTLDYRKWKTIGVYSYGIEFLPHHAAFSHDVELCKKVMSPNFCRRKMGNCKELFRDLDKMILVSIDESDHVAAVFFFSLQREFASLIGNPLKAPKLYCKTKFGQALEYPSMLSINNIDAAFVLEVELTLKMLQEGEIDMHDALCFLTERIDVLRCSAEGLMIGINLFAKSFPSESIEIFNYSVSKSSELLGFIFEKADFSLLEILYEQKALDDAQIIEKIEDEAFRKAAHLWHAFKSLDDDLELGIGLVSSFVCGNQDDRIHVLESLAEWMFYRDEKVRHETLIKLPDDLLDVSLFDTYRALIESSGDKKKVESVLCHSNGQIIQDVAYLCLYFQGLDDLSFYTLKNNYFKEIVSAYEVVNGFLRELSQVDPEKRVRLFDDCIQKLQSRDFAISLLALRIQNFREFELNYESIRGFHLLIQSIVPKTISPISFYDIYLISLKLGAGIPDWVQDLKKKTQENRDDPALLIFSYNRLLREIKFSCYRGEMDYHLYYFVTDVTQGIRSRDPIKRGWAIASDLFRGSINEVEDGHNYGVAKYIIYCYLDAIKSQNDVQSRLLDQDWINIEECKSPHAILTILSLIRVLVHYDDDIGEILEGIVGLVEDNVQKFSDIELALAKKYILLYSLSISPRLALERSKSLAFPFIASGKLSRGIFSRNRAPSVVEGSIAYVGAKTAFQLGSEGLDLERVENVVRGDIKLKFDELFNHIGFCLGDQIDALKDSFPEILLDALKRLANDGKAHPDASIILAVLLHFDDKLLIEEIRVRGQIQI